MQFTNIDEYINTFPDEVRTMLQNLRETISEEIRGAEEDISYNMPTFKVNGENVIYFATWKKHISLYPFTSSMEDSFQEASEYKISGKGTIQFPLDSPLPLPLIRKIVKFRLKDNKQDK